MAANIPGQQKTAETVLLRQPLPKYSFQGRKLPKEAEPTSLQSLVSSEVTSQQKIGSAAPLSASVIRLPNSENMGIRNGSDRGQDRKSVAVKPFSSAITSPTDTCTTDQHLNQLGQDAAKTVAAFAVHSLQANPSATGSTIKSVASVGALKHVVKFELGGKEVVANTVEKKSPSLISKNGEQMLMTFLPPPACRINQKIEIPMPDTALLVQAVDSPTIDEKLEKAEKEIGMLKSQLEVQLQVNAEIKRLLVASVGEDFERKVESLARDRAQLALELGDFSKKMTEDYEHLDQISIQADMWRSKYLASRVMVEELASARAFYSSQFQDSQQAVQELLNERYELRSNLLQSYKCLQQVKEAFDPLNARKSHSLNSTNVLDLASSIKQLSEAVRFRLLPAHASSHVIMPLEESWESSMSRAELFAYEQLTKQTAPPSFKHSTPGSTAPVSVLTTSQSYERFHPLTRHDNVTVNCCVKCKGEITVA